MAIQQFLAMTGAEIRKHSTLPPHIAWMACHFSPYATGLSNIPKDLPAGSMVIVNDRTPVYHHDPVLIAEQLGQMVENICCSSILLDFQRPDVPETAEIVKAIIEQISCPIGVTEHYAKDFDCAVFLPPVPPHLPPEEYLQPWPERDIWLELALDGTQITVTESGCKYATLAFSEPAEKPHHDSQLHCHYHATIDTEQVSFHLYRNPEDLLSILTVAEALGVSRAVGLYQELNKIIPGE